MEPLPPPNPGYKEYTICEAVMYVLLLYYLRGTTSTKMRKALPRSVDKASILVYKGRMKFSFMRMFHCKEG
jgi:hypothetical protein